jgi:hypothetical protein
VDLRLVERHFETAVHGFNDVLDAIGAFGASSARAPFAAASALGRRHDAVHEADCQRFVRLDLTPGQQQSSATPFADKPRETCDPAYPE